MLVHNSLESMKDFNIIVLLNINYWAIYRTFSCKITKSPETRNVIYGTDCKSGNNENHDARFRNENCEEWMMKYIGRLFKLIVNSPISKRIKSLISRKGASPLKKSNFDETSLHRRPWRCCRHRRGGGGQFSTSMDINSLHTCFTHGTKLTTFFRYSIRYRTGDCFIWRRSIYPFGWMEKIFFFRQRYNLKSQKRFSREN